MAELPKTYNPGDVERGVYRRWEQSGFFNPDKLPNAAKRKPFVISMPPPNITGDLHIGHAIGMTIQDILIRFQRMRGRRALWVPGTDHAAIATQVVVERELRKQGIDRRELGREKFLAWVWEWKKRYGSKIIEQIKRMGASADWSRLCFTMDDGLSAAVQTAFIKMYRDGLIYRGERIINWCVDCHTSISDLEVEHQDTLGKLWHICYPLADKSGHLVVATTRPETMLGDTAVAVHPDDPRYKSLIGKTIKLPLVGRIIPIIADRRVEREFGTGAVKVTPAHDPLDFELGQTHKLASVQVIGFDGRMTSSAGQDYVGRTVTEARGLVVSALRQVQLLEKEEGYQHAVGYCSRSQTVIEPLVSRQWFVKMASLAKPAVAAMRSGKIKIVPLRFAKVYYSWLENIRDWNISRQIWWGHRLPVWYRAADKKHDQPRVSISRPGQGWIQDEDTLDTWFSSALWTFSTLGWPKITSDLKKYHPTEVMETGWDILFFWVARMVMMSEYFLKQVPFRTIYIHGLILNEFGKKMSKSRGTGIDPIPVAEKYGMDALRLSLVLGNAAGQDFRIFEKKIEGYRNFINKLWNVARFATTQPRPRGPVRPLTLADRWILTRLNTVTKSVTADFNRFDFSAAGQRLYDFIWHDYADWYLEAAKINPNNGVLYIVLEQVLRLLHPFAPFVTEELWRLLGHRSLLMVEAWPRTRAAWRWSMAVKHFTALQLSVVALRNFRAHSGLPNNAPVTVMPRGIKIDAALLTALTGLNIRLVDRLNIDARYKELTLGSLCCQLPLVHVQRYEQWRQRERESLDKFITGLEQKLSNSNFIDHAPVEIVKTEREKLAVAKNRRIELVS